MSSATLALACARYWRSVAPVVRAELAGWQRRAAAIDEPRRRTLALAKLREERFNPQLAATLATLAPPASRRTVTAAIVAAQVGYDYRDALQEHSLAPGTTDVGYLSALAAPVRRAHAELPGWEAVAEHACTARARCEEAQRRGHAALGGDEEQLRAWARGQAAGSGLDWPEWLAGAQASILSEHALLALAADRSATSDQAAALDLAYLSIGALTMLDSLVDSHGARAAGELGYARWYASPRQMGERLAAVARQAGERAADAPGTEHHRLTLAGIVAYYASAPRARAPAADPVFAALRGELGASLKPTLAIMRAWRLSGSVGSLAQRARRAARPALAIAALLAVASAVQGPADAGAARSLRASDEAHLRYVSASGATLYETGRASGTLPGSMRVHMRIGPTFSGNFTIYTAGGTIAGHGSAVPHGAGVYESFAGSLTVSGGTGRYRRASGTAQLYGTFDRANYALVIQTKGTLHY